MHRLPPRETWARVDSGESSLGQPSGPPLQGRGAQGQWLGGAGTSRPLPPGGRWVGPPPASTTPAIACSGPSSTPTRVPRTSSTTTMTQLVSSANERGFDLTYETSTD